MKQLRQTFLLSLLFVSAGCVANTARQMMPLPSQRPILSLAGNLGFETADKWSFAQAIFRYPAWSGGEYHQIPIGDYLLAGLVERSNGTVSQLRLISFSSSGKMGRGLIGRHITSLHVEISYIKASTQVAFRFDARERDIGPFYSGDNNAAPLIGFRVTDDKLFHDQVRPLIDEILASFSKQIGGS